jgi:hypothetical protein
MSIVHAAVVIVNVDDNDDDNDKGQLVSASGSPLCSVAPSVTWFCCHRVSLLPFCVLLKAQEATLDAERKCFEEEKRLNAAREASVARMKQEEDVRVAKCIVW